MSIKNCYLKEKLKYIYIPSDTKNKFYKVIVMLGVFQNWIHELPYKNKWTMVDLWNKSEGKQNLFFTLFFEFNKICDRYK